MTAASNEPDLRRSRVPRWAIIGIFFMLLIGALAYARNFLMPVVLAVLLHLVFTPIRRQLERIGFSPGVAAVAIVGSLVALLVAAVLGLAAPVSSWVERAPLIGYELEQKFGQVREATEGVQRAAERVDDIADGDEAVEPGVQRVRVEEDTGLLAYAMALPAVLAQVMFTLVLLFFLLSSGDMFYEKTVHVIPRFRDKRTAIRIAYDIERKLSHYLFTIATINAGLGIAVGIAMWAIGMPNPVLFGVIACLLNFIPYVGALAGVVLATLVGAVTFDQIAQAFLAGGIYFALTSFEGQFVTPYFVGRSLRLNTVVVFLCVTLFAWLWSVVGMLVATPLLVTARTFCEHIPSLQGVGHFLSSRGAETVPEDQEHQQARQEGVSDEAAPR